MIFTDIEKLRPCYPPSAPATRERGISTLRSKLRTFGSTDPKRPEHRESGAGMTKPNGIEIRIFDHFKIKHLPKNPLKRFIRTCMSTIISYSNYFNPLLTFVSLSIAIILGIMTIYGKIKGKLWQN